MSRKNVNFDSKKHLKSEKVVKIDNIDVNKILVSKEEPHGTKKSLKYLIRYNDNDVVRPLCVKLPQMTGYAKKIEFNLNLIQFNYGDDEKYIKTKIKRYGNSVITNFHSKKMPKEKAPCKCLSIIMLEFVIEAKKKYSPQILLEECKYEQERIKIENLIDDDLEKSESDESDSDDDE